MKESKQRTATQCVHAGTISDHHSGGVNSPITTSSAFGFLEKSDNVYPRYFNTPNQQAVVEKLSALEGAESGLVVSSGMAAISTAFVSILNPGDHVVMQDQIYGGTYYFATSQFIKLGVTFTMVKGNQIEDFQQAIQPNTRILYFETPSNPLLTIIDVAGMADLARSNGIISIIDNTFASPINQNPLGLGVDMVMHSGTKYLGGHSDLCFGALLTNRELAAKMRGTAVNWGGSLDANACYLIERSLKTLQIRVRQQNENAQYLAEQLQAHPGVKSVYYPGLEAHPAHELAKRQMTGFGGMLSFELKESGQAVGFCKRLKLIKPALSLGGVETIISIPCLTSHIKMTKEERMAAGVSDDLLRLSVGIEDVEDLWEDVVEQLIT